VQLQSALRQSEFCIARLVLKKVFDYSVVLCKILQRRSIDLYEEVNTAEDIISEMKSLRQNAECEFHELFVSAQETAQKTQETAQNKGFSLDMPRLTPGISTDATLLLQQMKNIFEWEFLSHFWIASLQISSRDLLPTNPLLVDCSV